MLTGDPWCSRQFADSGAEWLALAMPACCAWGLIEQCYGACRCILKMSSAQELRKALHYSTCPTVSQLASTTF